MESGIASKKTTIAGLITMVGGGGIESLTTGMIRGDSPLSLSKTRND